MNTDQILLDLTGKIGEMSSDVKHVRTRQDEEIAENKKQRKAMWSKIDKVEKKTDRNTRWRYILKGAATLAAVVLGWLRIKIGV